jgi:2-polyprenyl-6-methoxyphenol hydroxylase-like FAD-dependent oxidoreductase
MKPESRILVSGAGVAGLTTVIGLARHGLRPVVVEHAPDVRADGYIISLSHRSYRYAESLGLLPAINERLAGVTHSSYHRGGIALLELDYTRLFDGVEVLQIMRDDLQDILWREARERADFRFGTSITAIDDRGAAARVTFSDGREEEFDAVIGADGAHSNVRQLCWRPDEVSERHLGLCCAAYRLPNIAGLRHKFETHMERDRYMVLFTTPQGGLAAVFGWASTLPAAPPPGARADVLRRAYADTGPLARRVLEHCPADGAFYMDPLVQVRLGDWYRGRAALIGDAAHCLTLISGQGATMAFTGACALVDQLVRHDDLATAYAAYEADLRDLVFDVQDRTRAASRWYVPRSWWRQSARDLGMWLFPVGFFERYFKTKYSRA